MMFEAIAQRVLLAIEPWASQRMCRLANEHQV